MESKPEWWGKPVLATGFQFSHEWIKHINFQDCLGHHSFTNWGMDFVNCDTTVRNYPLHHYHYWYQNGTLESSWLRVCASDGHTEQEAGNSRGHKAWFTCQLPEYQRSRTINPTYPVCTGQTAGRQETARANDVNYKTNLLPFFLLSLCWSVHCQPEWNPATVALT